MLLMWEIYLDSNAYSVKNGTTMKNLLLWLLSQLLIKADILKGQNINPL